MPPDTTPAQPPLLLRHRSGAEWMLHMAGNALARRRRPAPALDAEAIWAEVAAFVPCG